MAIARNKLYPVLALLASGLVGGIIWRQVSTPAPTPPAPATPAGGPKAAAQRQGATGGARPADGDSAAETLATVVASNAELRRQVQAAMEQNERVRAERDELRGGQEAITARAREQVLAQLRAEGVLSGDAGAAPAAGPTPTAVGSAGTGSGTTPGGTLATRGAAAVDRAGQAIGQAMDSAGTLLDGLKRGSGSAPRAGAAGGATASASNRPAGRTVGPAGNATQARPHAPQGIPPGLGYDDLGQPVDGQADVDTTSYRVIAPVGYAEAKDKRGGGAGETHLVRTAIGALPSASTHTAATASEAGAGVMAPGSAPAAAPDTPFFTIPENATLTRVTVMTAIVGRVPVDGRVTDPMPFKAIIGRENLAANGWDVPDDVSGIVVSGVAIGDMALSCSEGRIHSLTFVFDDGALRTVSTRRRGGATGGTATGGTAGQAGAGSPPALGYITDLWGNPCISGRFVTNAPAYLTDVVGLRSLGVASRAYAAAQTTTTDSAQTGTTSSAVTGSRGAYVLGQAASGATDEVTNWVLGRLKNSFDAVVTRAGEKVVLNIEQDIAIDRPAKPRRLDHQQAARASVQQGDRHGLD